MKDQALIENFHQLRMLAGLPSRTSVAAYLRVDAHTIRRWESGHVRIPWSAVLALRARAGHLGMIDSAWRGWILRDGCLWSREVNWSAGIRPGDILALPYLLQLQDELRRSSSKHHEAIANAIG